VHLGTMSGTTLTLNVGSRNNLRGVGNGEDDENFLVEQVGGTAGDATIKVTAFGRSNTYEHVANIVGDFGNGNDVVTIADNVVVPVAISGGYGADVITYKGATPSSTIYGALPQVDSGCGADPITCDDYIEVDSDSPVTVYGGAGSDFLINTGSGRATLNGEDGQDNLIGNTHADILSGGDDGDVLTGP